MSAPLSDSTRTAVPRQISRRRLLSSVPALGGLLLAGCSRELGTPPVIRGGLVGAADVLTMGVNRWLLADQPLAREFPPSEIAAEFPTWGQTNPPDEEYQRLLRDGFRDWRLQVRGLVGNSGLVLARRPPADAGAHADHRSHLRAGMVGHPRSGPASRC